MAANYELPNWLNPAPERSPADYFVAGSNAGSQIAHNFITARNNAEESARADALMPLRQKLMQNQVSSTALDIQKGLYDQQDYLDSKQGLIELSAAAQKISQDGRWADPTAEADIYQKLKDNPSLFRTNPREVASVLSNFTIAGKAAIAQKDAETRASRAQSIADLKQQEIDNLRSSRDLDRASRDFNSSDARAAQLQIAKMKLEGDMNKALLKGADTFDDNSKKRQDSEGVRGIYKREDLSPDQKIQAAEDLRIKIRDGQPVTPLSNVAPEDRSDANARNTAVEDIQGQIAKLTTDIAKNPRKFPRIGSGNPLSEISMGDPKMVDPRLSELHDLQGQLGRLKGDQPSAAPAQAAPAGADESVIVVTPDGRRGRIPKSQLKDALKQGYKEYEG